MQASSGAAHPHRAGGRRHPGSKRHAGNTIAVTDVKPQDTVTICLPEDTEIAKNDVMTRAMDLLLHAEISYITKEQIANLLHKADGKVAILAAELQSMELSNDLRGALLEIITA